MAGKQLTLNFDNAVTLIDKDGDKFVFNRWADKNKAVMIQDILTATDNGITVIPARCVVGTMTVSLR